MTSALAALKGVDFLALRDAGDPVEVARRYDEQGADEITFLDITASSDDRDIILHIVEQVADQVFIPLTVGGGVRTVADVRRHQQQRGADRGQHEQRCSQLNPDLVAEASGRVGSQCIVVAIDAASRLARQMGSFAHGGRKNTGLDAIEWARRVEALGAGEILLTSMDRDGTRGGFDHDPDTGHLGCGEDNLSSPAVVSVRWRILLTVSGKAVHEMRYWPPVSFTTASTPCMKPSNSCVSAASR